MRIIIDILHPAHVHFFKNFIRIMTKKKHKIFITSREKEITNYLLKEYGFNSISLSSIGHNTFELGKELLIRSSKFLSIALKIKPDLLMGIMGPTISPIGKLLNKPSLVFYDSEFAKITNRFSYPLATKVITPSCYKDHIGNNHIKYEGYQELAYLHPNYFKPDASILDTLNISKKDRFFVLRLVSWKASHDIGFKGLSIKNTSELINKLEDYGQVFITSERPFPKKDYLIKVAPEKIHSLLNYAHMYIGEGVTMASESAILGTPSFLISPLVGNIGYLENLEKYDLAYSFREFNPAFNKIKSLLDCKNLKEKWKRKRNIMLKDKIDVTNFIVEYVESNYA